jgi:hypothetical protein
VNNESIFSIDCSNSYKSSCQSHRKNDKIEKIAPDGQMVTFEQAALDILPGLKMNLLSINEH